MNKKQIVFIMMSLVLTVFGFATFCLLLQYPDDAKLLATPLGITFIMATILIGFIGSIGLMAVICQEGEKVYKFFGEMMGNSLN